MPKKEMKTIAVKKPLNDISNGERLHKTGSSKGEQCEVDVLDRLILIQTKLTTLVHRIDELVAKAFTLKTKVTEGKTEIGSFTEFLSGVFLSLEEWVPRLEALSSFPVEPENVAGNREEDSQTGGFCLVSPSPLVSGRAGFPSEISRQLFVSSPLQNPTRSNTLPLSETKEELNQAESISLKPSSPPRSLVLLDPCSMKPHKVKKKVHKATPYHYRTHKKMAPSSDLSSDDMCKSLILKNPELRHLECRERKIESSPHWLISPLKTCVLLDPPNNMALSSSRVHSMMESTPAIKSTRGSALMEVTPLQRLHEAERRPGETTLKRELWTKFEAASMNGIGLGISILRKTGQKEFLDRLEEACEEKPGGLR